MIRWFTNQWYLLQLENYDVKRFLRLILKGLFIRIKRRRLALVYTAKLRIIIFLAVALQILLGYWLAHNGPEFFAYLLLTFVFHSFFLAVAVIVIAPVDFLVKFVITSKATKKVKSFPKLKVIGITGSYGKTTMKEALYSVLSTKYKVIRADENINTPIGISRFILKELNEGVEILIVEMGAYKNGDIRKLCKISTPDIAVLTGINEAHLERFKNIENTIEAKFEIVVSAKPDALIVLNGEDHSVTSNYERYVGNRRIQWYENKSHGYTVPLLGAYALGVVDACVIISKELGLVDTEISTGISKIKPVPHRLQLLPTTNGITVIDDSYNGNPAGVVDAIKLLSTFKDKRKIFVTPGLVEMGDRKKQVHEDTGRALAVVADLVVLIRNSVTPYIASQIDPSKVMWFDDAEKAHLEMKNILKAGDVVMFQNDWPENYL